MAVTILFSHVTFQARHRPFHNASVPFKTRRRISA